MNTFNYIIYIPIVIQLIYSCQPKQPEFVFSTNLSSTSTTYNSLILDSVHYILEYYIVKNPSKNKKKLFAITKHHNDSLSKNDFMLMNTNVDLIRYYYKESRNTPVDYKEEPEGFFDSDEIGDHEEDLVLDCHMYTYDGTIETDYFDHSRSYAYYPKYDKRIENNLKKLRPLYEKYDK